MNINGRRDLDIERAIQDVRHYTQSTGIGCLVIDMQGRLLSGSQDETADCSFCRLFNRMTGRPDSCMQAHLYGSYQAERFGGRYIYFCPNGLVHWASPILADGMLQAALVAGPALLVEPGEYFREDIVKKYELKPSQIKVIKAELSAIPYLRPETVTSLSELLFIVSRHASSADMYEHGRDLLEQQSSISEYIHHIKTMGGDESSIDAYPVEKERELINLISLGDKTGSQKLLNEILGHVFFANGAKLEIIKARVLELVVLLSRAAMQGGADVEQIFGLNFNYLNQIHSHRTVEDLSWWLSRIMLRFTDLVFDLQNVKHVDVIYKAVDFIKKNYMNKIGLKTVSDHVQLSPSYFSKIFKDEMRCNFNAFLNQVRIEQSRTALLDKSIALVDVASLMGFEDQSYFTKVFKRLTGVSPGRYRESRGRPRREDTP
jgi:two-component system, response regulator YesN